MECEVIFFVIVVILELDQLVQVEIVLEVVFFVVVLRFQVKFKVFVQESSFELELLGIVFVEEMVDVGMIGNGVLDSVLMVVDMFVCDDKEEVLG